MYVGHAAIALALKSRSPRVPLLALTLACYGPDWVDAALMIPHPRAGMAPWSHSLPAVAIGALAAGAVYALFAQQPGATALIVGWLLHWPADFLTGLKPLVGLAPLVGLDLYHAPVADFALETACIVAACVLFSRSVARAGVRPLEQILRDPRDNDKQILRSAQDDKRRFAQDDKRRVIVALCIAMILLQLGFDVVVPRMDGLRWNPSLADAR